MTLEDFFYKLDADYGTLSEFSPGRAYEIEGLPLEDQNRLARAIEMSREANDIVRKIRDSHGIDYF